MSTKANGKVIAYSGSGDDDAKTLHKTEEGTKECAKFLHLPKRKFIDFALIRKEIKMRLIGSQGRANIYLWFLFTSISSLQMTVVNLTLIDLPGLTKVVVKGQPETIVEDIESMVRTYVDKFRIST